MRGRGPYPQVGLTRDVAPGPGALLVAPRDTVWPCLLKLNTPTCSDLAAPLLGGCTRAPQEMCTDTLARCRGGPARGNSPPVPRQEDGQADRGVPASARHSNENK